MRESPVNRVLFLHASEAESDMESSVTLGTKVSFVCCDGSHLAAAEFIAVAAINSFRSFHFQPLSLLRLGRIDSFLGAVESTLACCCPLTLQDTDTQMFSPSPDKHASAVRSTAMYGITRTPEHSVSPGPSPDAIVTATEDTVRRHIYQHAGRKPYYVDNVAKNMTEL